jgi:hypothetical protein
MKSVIQRLKVVLNRANCPLPGKPLGDEEVADILLFMAKRIEKLEKRVKELEEHPVTMNGALQ